MFFRKNPFKGQYAIFAGLDKVMEFLINFKFEEDEIDYLREIMPQAGDDFFEYLKSLNYKMLTVRGLADGTITVAHEPLLTIEGPLGFCQLIETTILVLCNYATLVCTNACRMRVALHDEFTDPNINKEKAEQIVDQILASKQMFEFGLRRAQGINGGMTASRYSIMGGFTGTSNVNLAKELGIKPFGTMAHAYIQSFTETLNEITPENTVLGDKFIEFIKYVKHWENAIFDRKNGIFYNNKNNSLSNAKKIIQFQDSNEYELAAYTHFAFTQPTNFLALVDTFNILQSGIPNFLIVACAMIDNGWTPNGVRLDSGDLALLSRQIHEVYDYLDEILIDKFDEVKLNPDAKYENQIKKCKVCASNDINESTIIALRKKGAQIDSYGIGTNLVTCQDQPALGGVYKLVEIDGEPRMKFTESNQKATLPFSKQIQRIYSNNGQIYADIVMLKSESAIQLNQQQMYYIVNVETNQKNIYTSKIDILLKEWIIKGGQINYPHKICDGKVILLHPDVRDIRKQVLINVLMMKQTCKQYDTPSPLYLGYSNTLSKIIRLLAPNQDENSFKK